MNIVEPIRDKQQIEGIKRILRGNGSTGARDYLLFVLGINTALRISDLLALKVDTLVDSNGKVRACVNLREQKTGKVRNFPINDSVKKALAVYTEAYPNLAASEFLFFSRQGENMAISRVRAWQILNNAARKAGIHDAIGNHTLRKTYGYHAYQQGADIAILQKTFGHSAPSVTLRYIGITQDDIDQVYIKLNL